MSRGLVVLAACFGPLHRTSEPHRAEDRDELTRILGHLASEPSSYFRGNHAQPILGNPGDDRPYEPGNMGILRCVPERQLAGGLHELCNRGARLDRCRDQALLDDPLFDDDLCRLECGVDVATGNDPVERLVLWNVWMNLRRPVQGGLLRIDDRWQRLVIHVDEIEGVVRLVTRFRHRHRDRIANVADDLLGNRQVLADLQVRVRHQPAAGDRLQVPVDVLPGEHADDAWGSFRARGVDPFDARMRVRAAEDGRVHHAGQRDVVGVLRTARNQTRIFASADARSENSRAHGRPPIADAASCTARTMFW